MNQISRYLDGEFIPQQQNNLIDYRFLWDEILYAPVIYIIRTNRKDSEGKPVNGTVKNSWDGCFTIERSDGRKQFDAYTSFGDALARCKRDEEMYPMTHLRVERVRIIDMLENKFWVMNLYGVYGENVKMCDGKTAYSEDYWKDGREYTKRRQQKKLKKNTATK